MMQNFAEWHIDDKVIGWTPIIGGGTTRGTKINAWLKAQTNKIDKFVIIDDRSDMDNFTHTNLVLCKEYDGINQDVKKKTIEILMN